MEPIQAIRESRALIILRGDFGDRLKDITQILVEEGFLAIEVAMNSPHALEQIAQITQALKGRATIGAGTVLSIEEARRALEAGACFIVSPHTDESLLAFCREGGIPAIPGAFTPSEIWRAWQGGAAMVKIFPAMPGGPEYLRNLRGPFPDIPFLPTGGVTVENAAAFLSAGAVAVGVGSALVGSYVMAPEGLSQLREACRRLYRSLRAL
ncbi:bifunctional 4-hydroxy-2-oxoglutarate aldolase/2-dehydro-3-deoxy-phosphogluconate aldolase [Thermoflexus sp.]|uniref:bifunctional 4-hydroxy-2-oxoglutarate aldolase/2-dehydro-3-deoxy-phosphogluconate aldolase n=1 Tax=Thermoflexus sp. TaxID=1969742 RepID=UPI0025E8ED20|nr:bifunctional 4-hydroxy-2-oxoglutarate aldolase/2-dehydro-3-deoxy-phosphogluconate aldolase [Thermoflexus sp.]MDW8065937.1 bifunctional 4-hydroxy-2-oxoglutarate aldolase/2-dehydro-3-deoxy-phosphogluconate aldolase [Anaerolineae bacterium]MCS7350772.1 bifunctional 4-hydroxy-2-oxoglutarate aldolase/2-dehydro-3-deoxy-phosphogluconate aldolase [Thermoflexus sp.]MCX7689856.1 bifunctional 4-hydroxy-2-oxoglutarate aldolase/2-dehydro-3-deoxy-phosphogluconate aldolase [Thermoflexus sp.]MDW8180223.1 bi